MRGACAAAVHGAAKREAPSAAQLIALQVWPCRGRDLIQVPPGLHRLLQRWVHSPALHLVSARDPAAGVARALFSALDSPPVQRLRVPGRGATTGAAARLPVP